jgi:chromosome segregation ATPase
MFLLVFSYFQIDRLYATVSSALESMDKQANETAAKLYEHESVLTGQQEEIATLTNNVRSLRGDVAEAMKLYSKYTLRVSRVAKEIGGINY